MSLRVVLAALSLAGCGRIGFDAERDARAADGSATTDTPAGAPITWVRTFVQQASGSTSQTAPFTATANAGDAIVIHVFCKTATQPTSVTISAQDTLWSFVRLGSIVGNTTSMHWATEVGAIAPASGSVAFLVTWSGSCIETIELGDEFANADPTGGATTFEAHDEVNGNGNCTGSVTTLHAGDAIWSACSGGPVSAVDQGFTKSADDGVQDWSEYELTTDPAGTIEDAGFADTGDNVATTVAIRPAS